MGEKNQGKKMAVRGKEVFVGIDVHKESWQVTVQGEIMKGGGKKPPPRSTLHLLMFGQGMFWGLKIIERSNASRFNI